MPKSLSKSSSHSPVRRLQRRVREALVTSVACTRRPVSCQSSHVSTVPKRSLPASACARAPGVFSRIQRSFVAEKYGSRRRPVFSATSGSRPSRLSCAQKSAVRRSCHTIALHTGRPVSRSHTRVVSRWLVMPTAAMSPEERLARAMASAAVELWLDQISIGSCSTQPGCG